MVLATAIELWLLYDKLMKESSVEMPKRIDN